MSPADSVPYEKQVLEYVEDQLTAEGAFIKSRHIARETDVSAKRAGAVLSSIEERASGLRVEKWGGNSDGTTWYVERVE